MSYEHLADVFSRAIVDTRSIPAALEIVDAYRIRGAGVELAGGLPTLALRVAAHLFGVPAGRILSRDRHDDLCRARWVAAWLLHGHGWKPRKIARALRQDRTTVMHGLKKVRGTPDLLATAKEAFAVLQREIEAPVSERQTSGAVGGVETDASAAGPALAASGKE
jgi:hypothetical protein